MPRAVIPDGCAFWRLRDEDILNNIFSPAVKEVQFGTLYNYFEKFSIFLR